MLASVRWQSAFDAIRKEEFKLPQHVNKIRDVITNHGIFGGLAAERAFLEDWAEAYNAGQDSVDVEVLYKETEELRNHYIFAAIGGKGPDLIYGPADNVGMLAITETIRPLDDLVEPALFEAFIDEGLLRCSVDEALQTGAHGVFYPHGTGHHLGLDVHDLENFGDLPSYPPGQGRPSQFGTQNLRLDLPLERDWVVTIEPGIYFVPAILADQSLRESLGDRVDWDKAQDWIGFGGIRIEDDVCVTDMDPEVLTSAIPKSVEAVEALVGSGPTPEERLC